MLWRKILAVLTLTAIMASLASPALAQNYGAHSPTNAQYQVDWRPFNDGKFAESINFTCIMSDGYFLGSDRQDILSDILQIGGKIYGGSLEAGDFEGGGLAIGDSSDSLNGNPYDEGPQGTDVAMALTVAGVERDYNENRSSGEKYHNLGYEVGKDGLQNYLRNIKEALNDGLWQNSMNTKIRIAEFKGTEEWKPDSGVLLFDTGEKNGKRDVPKKVQKTMAKLINTDAFAPIDSFVIGGTNGLPPGCQIEPFAAGEGVAWADITSDLDQAFTTLIFSVPSRIVQEFYGWISPAAMKYSFWTPHTERGDLFWEVPESCDVTNKNKVGVISTSTEDGCKGGVPLGYSEKNLDVNKQGSGSGVFIKVAAFIKWLLSGTYMLIIFAAAALFIVRGSANNNFNLLKLLPRIFLAMGLTITVPYLMGVIISFSNTLVQSLFQDSSGTLVTQINLILSQSGIVFGGGEFFERIVNIVVGALSTWFMLQIFLVSIFRQVILIALVVIAPVATFSLISDAWKSFFGKWLRAFLAVAFLPAIMALILKIGVLINPLFASPENAYGTMAGALGIILMVLILYLMAKAARAGKDFAFGQSSTATAAMGGFGSGLQAAGAMTGNKYLTGAGNRLGQRVQDSAAQSSAQSGSMIPVGRGSAAGAAGAGGAGSGSSTGSLGFAERRKAKALAKGKMNEIDEGSYYQLLAHQNGLGKEKFHQTYGFTVEKNGGSFYKSFAAPAGSAAIGQSDQIAPEAQSPQNKRKKKIFKAKASFDTATARQASTSKSASSAGPPSTPPATKTSASGPKTAQAKSGFSASSETVSLPAPQSTSSKSVVGRPKTNPKSSAAANPDSPALDEDSNLGSTPDAAMEENLIAAATVTASIVRSALANGSINEDLLASSALQKAKQSIDGAPQQTQSQETKLAEAEEAKRQGQARLAEAEEAKRQPAGPELEGA